MASGSNTRLNGCSVVLMTFRVTWKSHIRQAWTTIFYAALVPIVPIYLHYRHGIEDVTFAAVTTASGFFCLILVPHILIHFRYAMVSHGVTVDFDSQNRRVTFSSGDDVSVINDRDIKSLDMVLTRSLARDGIDVYPWQLYGYATINLHSGGQFLITSLQVPRMKIPYEFRDINVQEHLYCWPS